MTELFPADVLRKLRENGEANLHQRIRRHHPVVKIVNPYGGSVWLLTELDPAEPDHLYGLADLANGHPIVGWVSREALETVRLVYLGYHHPLERDATFVARYPLDVYAHAARAAKRIIEHPDALDRAAQAIAQRAPS